MNHRTSSLVVTHRLRNASRDSRTRIFDEEPREKIARGQMAIQIATSGCGTSATADIGDSKPKPKEPNPAIAVLYYNDGSPYCDAFREGIETAVGNRKTAIKWYDAANAPEQSAALDLAIAENHVAYCICPLAVDMFADRMTGLKDSGKPVVIAERPLTTEPLVAGEDFASVPVYSFGVDATTVEAIKSQTIAATILDDPYTMGLRAVARGLDEDSVTGLIAPDEHIVTGENLEDARTEHLLGINVRE